MNDTLDLTRLDEIFDGDREAIGEILVECARYVGASIGELDRAARAGDAGGVVRAAHGIKGSCANVGALACEREAKAIESQARAGVLHPNLADDLVRHHGRLEAAIATYVAGV
ncbi:MAG: hypothetical protein NVS1B2_09820 [Vulcanimicrobiaceae bacterium]